MMCALRTLFNAGVCVRVPVQLLPPSDFPARLALVCVLREHRVLYRTGIYAKRVHRVFVFALDVFSYPARARISGNTLTDCRSVHKLFLNRFAPAHGHASCAVFRGQEPILSTALVRVQA